MADQLIDFTDSAQRTTMSSLEIAKETGKRHKDVLEAIRKMEPAWERICGRKFPLTSTEVKQPNGGFRSIPMYDLNYKECMYVAAKFNDEARAKLVKRWDDLETGREKPIAQQKVETAMPRTQAEIILMQAQQLVAQEQMMRKIEAKQSALEEKVSEIAVRTKTNIQYSTIIGFASRYGIHVPWRRPLPLDAQPSISAVSTSSNRERYPTLVSALSGRTLTVCSMRPSRNTTRQSDSDEQEAEARCRRA